MAKKDIIKSIAPILDIVCHNREKLKKIADDLDALFDESSNQSGRDADRINNLFEAVNCLQEAEKYITQC